MSGVGLYFCLILGSHHKQGVNVVLDYHLLVVGSHLGELGADLPLLSLQHLLQFACVSVDKVDSGLLVFII